MPKGVKADVVRHNCIYCGQAKILSKYYRTSIRLYENNDNVLPICKECIAEIYDEYYKKYDSDTIKNKKKVCAKAVQRICMLFNLYYSDDVFEKAYATNSAKSLIAHYIKLISLMQHRQKTYDDTISEHKDTGYYLENDNQQEDDYEVDKQTVEIFGEGFDKTDYKFLAKEYKDWTSRHECSNKSQEEIFKSICMNRLKAYKANIEGKDTKDLDKTFRELLDTGKLQPKQNKTADSKYQNQPLGVLIGEWENTFKRPIDKPTKDLCDMEHIAVLDGFMRGHTCKTVGVNNSYSEVYSKLMKKYAAKRPEYSEDSDSDVAFDNIFGERITDSDDIDEYEVDNE